MSQAGILSLSDVIIPPDVPTRFVTDSGTVIPAAHVVNVNGASSTSNNINGISFIANPTLSNNLVGELTNRITGSITTTDGITPVTIYSFPLGSTPGTYLFNQQVVGYNQTDAIGAVYVGYRGVRTTGAAGVFINSNLVLVGEEGSFTIAEVVNSISGNNAVLKITGITGKVIDWVVVTTYTFVS